MIAYGHSDYFLKEDTMRQIELKKVKNEDGAELDYRTTILVIAKNHPQGIRVDNMEKAVRVIAAVRRANGMVKLEDADWQTLKEYIAVYPFAIADPSLIQFKEDIFSAQEVEIK